MKFSYRQILASAGGAVLSAVIASIFGVKGTIVGVAIGSVAATTGTALLFQSIERTNRAVKQVVVRVPESTRLLRRLGGTDAAGVTESTPTDSSSLTEETATSVVRATGMTDAGMSQPAPDPTIPDHTVTRTSLRWPVVAGVVLAVFVFSLALVTSVELIVGRPLADIFGRSGGGTTVEKVFENPPPTLPTPATTTTTTTNSSTTTSSSSSTTTSVTGSTTSSTDVGATTTTTPSTEGSGGSTTTTGP